MSQLSASINKSNSRSNSPTNATFAASLASPFTTDPSTFSPPAALATSVDTKPSVTFATQGTQGESTGELFSNLFSMTGGGSENNETNVSVNKNLGDKLASAMKSSLDASSCIIIEVDHKEVGIKMCGGLMGASKVKFCTKLVTENDGTCGVASHADQKIEISEPTMFITNKGSNGRKTAAFCKPCLPVKNRFITASMQGEGKTYAEWSGIFQNAANTIDLEEKDKDVPSTVSKVLKASQYIGITPKKGGTPFTDEFMKELKANNFELPDELSDSNIDGDAVKVDLTKEDFRRLLKSHMTDTWKLNNSVKRLSTMLLDRFEFANSQIGVLTNNIGINNVCQDNIGYSDLWSAIETIDGMVGINSVSIKDLQNKLRDVENLQLSNKLEKVVEEQATFLENWKIEISPGLQKHHQLYNMLTGPSHSPGKLLMDKIMELSKDITILQTEVKVNSQPTASTTNAISKPGSLFGVPFGPSQATNNSTSHVPQTDVEVQLLELKEEVKQVSARVGTEVVQFGEHTFRSLNEMAEFVNKEMGSEPIY